VVAAVYLRGEAVAAPIRRIVEGTVDPLVAVAGETVLGIREGFLCPLKSDEEVLGSLGFYGTAVLTPRETAVCEAFVREASLTLENARLAQRVRVQVERLQEARRRVTEAEERQRQEIAELLHSRVQSNLLLLWNKLGGARELAITEPERAKALLLEAQEELDRIRERDIRQASYLLHPAIIGVGLIPALRSLAARFNDLLTVTVSADAALASLDDPLHNRLPEDFRVSLYRIVEEALNNVQRHAVATQAEITLRVANAETLLLDVVDDGQGFDHPTARRGLGLTVIEDRVEQLRGQLRIESHVGAGTRVSASIPIPTMVEQAPLIP
jgi:signal transduction histidine kinase